MAKIDELRQDTYEDLVMKLNLFQRCALIRHCSFGKTYMALKLFENYKKILFLYPADCIKLMLMTRHSEKLHNNIFFMSYNRLARMSTAEIESLPDYDLIFADEAHRLGGEKTKIAFFTLQTSQRDDTHYVGSTATPNRMDGFDIIEEFFNGISVKPYTLHDAIHDGVVKKPYYYFCSLHPSEDIGTEIEKIYENEFKKKLTKKEQEEFLRGDIVEKFNIFSVENIIKEACEKNLSDTSYMKFICFFLYINDIKQEFKMIVNWFEKAFPNHRIRKTEIHSGDNATNIKVVETLKREENTIDLVLTCDMLNEGYHVSDITGIVMLRKTDSSRVYAQQIGRCLSSDANEEGKLIFDVVDNLHRASIFRENASLLDSFEQYELENKDRDSNEETTQQDNCDDESVDISDTEDKAKKIKQSRGSGVNNEDEPQYTTGKGWYKSDKFDVSAEFTLSTYKEFAFKVVLEAHSENITNAINEYLKCGFPLFKDRKEIAKNSSVKRALTYIAKANNLPLNLMYIAFESSFGNME